jgi:hypothetical protein
MATLHVLCGLPGSGKSTFARELLTQISAIRLANDDWMIALFGTNPPEPEFRVAVKKIEMLQWRLAEDLLRHGLDVIWDYGVWSRQDRADLFHKCAAVGAAFVLYDVQCDFEEAVRRVLARTANNPASEYWINREAMLAFQSKYQAPSTNEGYAMRIVQGDQPPSSRPPSTSPAVQPKVPVTSDR